MSKSYTYSYHRESYGTITVTANSPKEADEQVFQTLCEEREGEEEVMVHNYEIKSVDPEDHA